jgi:hypothetical protein
VNEELETFLQTRVGPETEVRVSFRGPVKREELIRLIQNLLIVLPDWPAKGEPMIGDVIGFREVKRVRVLGIQIGSEFP